MGRYLDCGCFFDHTGHRSWCPSCLSEGVTPKAEEKATKQPDSISLARLWTSLDQVKRTIENECIPLCAHLDVDATGELIQALDKTVDAIVNHVTKFRLQAYRREGPR